MEEGKKSEAGTHGLPTAATKSFQMGKGKKKKKKKKKSYFKDFFCIRFDTGWGGWSTSQPT